MNMIRAKIAFLTLLAAAVVALPFRSQAGYNTSLTLSGVAGPGASGAITVDSFSFGMIATNSRASFANMTVVKPLDIASPLLAFNCAKGTTNTTAVLSVVDQTHGNALYTVTLGNYSITSDQVLSSPGAVPTEMITIAYTSIIWTYQPLDSNGNTNGSPVTHNWNIAVNNGS